MTIRIPAYQAERDMEAHTDNESLGRIEGILTSYFVDETISAETALRAIQLLVTQNRESHAQIRQTIDRLITETADHYRYGGHVIELEAPPF